MESNGIPEDSKGEKEEHFSTPWAPLPGWKVPVFSGLLPSHLFTPLVVVSLPSASLSFSPHLHSASSLERKGETELCSHLRAVGWVTDIKVDPDRQDLSRWEQLPEEKFSLLKSSLLFLIPLLGILVPSSSEETGYRLRWLQSLSFCSRLTYKLI